jgi:hypothetical protein
VANPHTCEPHELRCPNFMVFALKSKSVLILHLAPYGFSLGFSRVLFMVFGALRVWISLKFIVGGIL